MMSVKKLVTEVGGKKLILETGKFAEQASGEVTARYGDTVILATAVISKNVREGIDYFPFVVDYEEKMYAAGKIKGSRFIKREGKPTEKAILTGRLVDRPLRPLFNKYLRNDIQVILTVFSADLENDPATFAINAASAALILSGVPFNGPVGAVRIGCQKDKFILNPTYEQIKEGKLDLTVAGTKDKVLMVEAAAKELPEEKIMEAIEFGHKALQPIIELQEKLRPLAKKIDPDKLVYAKPDDKLVQEVKSKVEKGIDEIVASNDRDFRHKRIDELEEETWENYKEAIEKGETTKAILRDIVNDFLAEKARKRILEKKIRPDGRKINEIRPITCEAGLLPRTHGSGLFTRGETQVLSVTTLGSVADEQIIDDMDIDEKKRFMHHYNFPPFSTGEVAPLRGPSRRDIGHGDLVERAFESLIPPKEKFPYTIRVVSEVLSSNGSSSMASVCATTLSLMDAGVQIKPVAGIAMGLITDDKGNYQILSDIQGIEDAAGDMDFKIAGTKDGITAIQADFKVEGISLKLVEEILSRAKTDRAVIMEKILQAIPAPRKELSPYAPRVISIQIKKEQIKDVIGRGGEMINKIIDETGAEIDIDDGGLVTITAVDPEACKKAVDWVKNLTRDVTVGEVFDGKVTEIREFGAFVEILPGKEGLLHISELASYRVNKVEDIVKVGDTLKVMIIGVDNEGKIRLSKRVLGKGTKQITHSGISFHKPKGKFSRRRKRGTHR